MPDVGNQATIGPRSPSMSSSALQTARFSAGLSSAIVVGLPGLGVSAVLAGEAVQVLVDLADRPPDAVLLAHGCLSAADLRSALAVQAVSQPAQPVSLIRRQGHDHRVVLAVPAAPDLDDNGVH